MRINAVPIRAKDLKPGELFSIAGPMYWDTMPARQSIGEKVWLRTETPCPEEEKNEQLYKIEVTHGA